VSGSEKNRTGAREKVLPGSAVCFDTMKKMKRLLASWLVLVFLSGPVKGGTEFSRPAMLRDLGAKVLIPGLQDLQRRSLDLAQAAQVLESEPTVAHVDQTQAAWRETCLAWKRVQWVQFGIVKDTAYWSALFYKGVYPQSIEGVIRSSRPMDAGYVEEMGAGAKGLYGLEYLLFDLPQGVTAWVGPDGKPTKVGTPRHSAKALLAGPDGARRRSYVRELARDFSIQLKAAVQVVEAKDFLAGYAKEAQKNVDLAANGMLNELESGVVNVLRLYVDQFANRALRYDQIEGAASALSVRVLSEDLAGLEKLYRGADGLGFDDYVKQVNPGLAGRLEERFKAAKAALAEFKDLPVDQALMKHYAAMERAYEQLRELEIQFKLDLMSSLGITLLFSSTDGD
jgi:predicted lipoprotein